MTKPVHVTMQSTYGKLAGYKDCCIKAFDVDTVNDRSIETRICCIVIINAYHWGHVLCHECACKYIAGEFCNISDFIDIDSRNHNIDTSDDAFVKSLKKVPVDTCITKFNPEKTTWVSKQQLSKLKLSSTELN